MIWLRMLLSAANYCQEVVAPVSGSGLGKSPFWLMERLKSIEPLTGTAISVQVVNHSDDEQGQTARQIEAQSRLGTQAQGEQNQSYLKHQERDSQAKAEHPSGPKKYQQHHKKFRQPEGGDEEKSCSDVSRAEAYRDNASLTQEREDDSPEQDQNTHEQAQSPA